MGGGGAPGGGGAGRGRSPPALGGGRPPPPEPVSVAASETATGGPYQLLEQVEPLHAIDEVGAVESTWISWLLVGSALAGTSQARYLTVVVPETTNGAWYAALESVGSEPSVVYRITATPQPES